MVLPTCYVHPSQVSVALATLVGQVVHDLVGSFIPTQVVGSSDSALPVVGATSVNDTEYITLTYRQYALETGLGISVLTSPDMTNWTAANATITQTGTDLITGDPIMQAQVPITTARQFVRLNVTTP